jgi:two-component sensor histidine kinase
VAREAHLREVHHRVKDNLCIVIALQNLQLDRIHDVEAHRLFIESITRIHVMSAIHDKLYANGNLGSIGVEECFRDLVQHTFSAYHVPDEDHVITTEFAALELDADTLVPCGLILNELATNSIKYAKRNGQRCEIDLGIIQSGESHVELYYHDRGNGVPSTLTGGEPTTFGLDLVTSLTQQLRGEMTLEHRNGFFFSVRFPAPVPSRRVTRRPA